MHIKRARPNDFFQKTTYRTYSGNAYLTVLKLQQMSANQRLFLLDAYALIFRGYYAFIKNPASIPRG